MSNGEKTYSYRGGKKIELEKSSDQMVVRMLPEALTDPSVISSEQVSSASTRITTDEAELESAMERSREIAPTHHAYYETEGGSEFLITDRVIVTFKTALADAEVDAFAGRYALTKIQTYSDRDYLFQLTNHTGMNPVKLVVNLMEQEPLVEIAEHDLNQRMSTYAISVPVDPEYQRQWHLHDRLNSPDFDTRSSTQCEKAWNLLDHFGSSEVVVAVSDDGCKLDHADFDSGNKFAGWGYMRGERLVKSIDIDANPSEMYKTGSNHGTSCCGVIAGEVDAQLTVGAAPGSRLLPVQWQSSGPSLFISDSKLMTVLDYISDKADIMSNSWGGVPTSLWATTVVNRIRTLAQTGGRRGKGIVFLWAAGNENCPINATTNQDVPFDDGVEQQGGSLVWVGVNTSRVFRNNLVGIPGLMHVAALASTARRSHYSNYGPGMSICAPTSNSHEYHRMTVRGLGITTTTGAGSGVTPGFGGTSSATPLVAGIAALTISAHQGLSALEVVDILKRTASKNLNLEGYAKTPPSSFDPDTSWDVSPVVPFDDGDFIDNGDPEGTWSPWFGHGRVDAESAVAEAIRRSGGGGGGGGTGGKSFKSVSSPDKSIPDNSAAGIKDKIVCPEAFIVRSIKVRVDIVHTYVGDLRVSLISPTGDIVVLHDRTGGSTHDLRREYSADSIPGLLSLSGRQVTGNWQLLVQDLATADRGRLTEWALDITGDEDASVTVFESPGVIIPDNSPAGIERTLAVTNSGTIDSIAVSVDITHTFIGDLVVELIAPDNSSVLLHNRTGSTEDNIIKTYTLLNTFSLQPLRGRAMQGNWRLKISDRANVDQGKLNHWELKLKAM